MNGPLLPCDSFEASPEECARVVEQAEALVLTYPSIAALILETRDFGELQRLVRSFEE